MKSFNEVVTDVYFSLFQTLQMRPTIDRGTKINAEQKVTITPHTIQGHQSTEFLEVTYHSMPKHW